LGKGKKRKKWTSKARDVLSYHRDEGKESRQRRKRGPLDLVERGKKGRLAGVHET